MGNDDAVNTRLYAFNTETGEKIEIGKGVTSIPKLAPGGIVNCEMPIKSLGENLETEITVKLKTITKKRFIKLLMAKGYQRNDAIKLHEKYMNEHKFVRSRLGLEFFIIKYRIKRI